jgi:hypothetical protein
MQSFAFNWLSSIFVTANKHCGCNDLDFLPLAWNLPLQMGIPGALSCVSAHRVPKDNDE